MHNFLNKEKSIIVKKLPAIHAFIKDEKFPASIALAAYFMKTFVLVGANTLKMAISIPTL